MVLRGGQAEMDAQEGVLPSEQGHGAMKRLLCREITQQGGVELDCAPGLEASAEPACFCDRFAPSWCWLLSACLLRLACLDACEVGRVNLRGERS